MLSKDSSVPLYKQVQTEILNDINAGVYQIGEMIPTETQLEEAYSTSRITIRKAIAQLVNDDVLLKKQGKGTFVQARKEKRNLLDLVSYTNYMKESGKTPDAVIRSLETISAEPVLAQTMHISENDQIIHLERTMEMGEGNFGYEISYYIADRYPELMSKIKAGISVTQILKDDYQAKMASSDQTINVIFASQQIAEYLNVENGAPIYQLDRVVYEANKNVMYYAVMYYDVNKVSFSVSTKEG